MLITRLISLVFLINSAMSMFNYLDSKHAKSIKLQLQPFSSCSDQIVNVFIVNVYRRMFLQEDEDVSLCSILMWPGYSEQSDTEPISCFSHHVPIFKFIITFGLFMTYFRLND